jgi:hypothetical protein
MEKRWIQTIDLFRTKESVGFKMFDKYIIIIHV